MRRTGNGQENQGSGKSSFLQHNKKNIDWVSFYISELLFCLKKNKKVDLTFPIPPLDSKYTVMPADFLGFFFFSRFEFEILIPPKKNQKKIFFFCIIFNLMSF